MALNIAYSLCIRSIWKISLRRIWLFVYTSLRWDVISYLRSFEKKVLLYKPLPLSWMTGLIGYITGKSPQFLNP